MHVRKFEGDTLEEVLQFVKKELGPDAIIIKTKTNRGISGAFKKKKIEITAAVSENSYIKKAKVDSVLDKEQKETFYRNNASDIKGTIQNYSSSKQGYGNIGLNKTVRVAKDDEAPKASVKSKLDDFLNYSKNEIQQTVGRISLNEFMGESTEEEVDEVVEQEKNHYVETSRSSSVIDFTSKLSEQERRIRELEAKLLDLSQSVNLKNRRNTEDKGIVDLHSTLRTLDIEENIVLKIIKNLKEELTKEELNDSDLVFDTALNYLNSLVKCKSSIFSAEREDNEGAISLFLSEGSSGQSAIGLKLANLYENTVLIKFSQNQDHKTKFVEKMLNIELTCVSSMSEALSIVRKMYAQGKNIIIDYKNLSTEVDETKKFIDSISRTFKNVEVMVVLSAIHAENYNRKIISKYKHLADAVIINHIDQCLNFGALINTHIYSGQKPVAFYGTGSVVPEDIETATPERLLAGLLEL